MKRSLKNLASLEKERRIVARVGFIQKGDKAGYRQKNTREREPKDVPVDTRAATSCWWKPFGHMSVQAGNKQFVLRHSVRRVRRTPGD